MADRPPSEVHFATADQSGEVRGILHWPSRSVLAGLAIAHGRSNDMRNVLTQARSLLMSQDNEEFRQKYQAVLQHDPAVVMEHAEVMKLLRPGSID